MSFFFSLETGSVLHRQQLDVDDQGPAMELCFQETGAASPVLAFGTSYGDVVGWDLRAGRPGRGGGGGTGGEAYRLRNGPRDGKKIKYILRSSINCDVLVLVIFHA